MTTHEPTEKTPAKPTVPAVAVLNGQRLDLRPYSMELLPGSVLTVSTPDGEAYLDVNKCDAPGDQFKVVDTADGEGGIAFDVDGSRVLWAPTAKAFGDEALDADLVFTDCAVGGEITFPPGFVGQPWPASDGGKVFLRPEQVGKAALSWEAETKRIAGAKQGPGSEPHPFKAARWTKRSSTVKRCRLCGAGPDAPIHDTDAEPVVKHGDPDDMTYRAKHPNARPGVRGPKPPAANGGRDAAPNTRPARGAGEAPPAKPTGATASDLSAEDRKTLLDYQKLDFVSVNGALRGRWSTDARVVERVGQLDRLMEAAPRTAEDASVFRAIQNPKLAAVLTRLKPGATITDGAFQSTTRDEDVAKRYAQGEDGVLATIRVPKGSQAIDMAQINDHAGENELLLAREAKYRVVETKIDADGTKRILLELQPPDGLPPSVAVTKAQRGTPAPDASRFVWQDGDVAANDTPEPDQPAPAGPQARQPAPPRKAPPPRQMPPAVKKAAPDQKCGALADAGVHAAAVTKAAAGPATVYDPVKRYTLGPLYPAAPHAVTRADLDAHDEFVTADDLQESVWDYVKSNDRKIRLQHGDGTHIIGEWVELMCQPAPVTVDLALPGGETVTKTFATGTPFMGVVWNELGWALVEKGLIRGFSFGGSAQKMTVEVEA